MLISKRRDNAIYKVTPQERDLWAVTVYADQLDANAHVYRSDLLPEWIHECVRILDVAGNRVKIPTIGLKVASTYWIGDVLCIAPVHIKVKIG